MSFGFVTILQQYWRCRIGTPSLETQGIGTGLFGEIRLELGANFDGLAGVSRAVYSAPRIAMASPDDVFIPVSKCFRSTFTPKLCLPSAAVERGLPKKLMDDSCHSESGGYKAGHERNADVDRERSADRLKIEIEFSRTLTTEEMNVRSIERKLFPMGLALVMAAAAVVPAKAAEKKDIVDTAVAAGSFKTLAAALQAADLVNALKGEGPFTVFAPTDAAFAKLPKGTVANLLKPENKAALAGILTYHVVAGKVKAADVVKLSNATTLNGQRVDIKVADGKVMVDNATVTATDIECANGVIHVIDSVILPTSDTIPATAQKAGAFKTLLAAVKAAGLVEVLSGKGPFTVFAPTDEAFAKLPKGTVSSLLKPENRGKLVAILKYHVVPGRVYSDAAVSAGAARTLQGGKLKIAVSKKGAMVNNARLVTLDVEASNGVIHVIDTVLLPSEGSKVGAAEAKKMIEHAIRKGSHLYNAGHHAACTEIYEQTTRKLVNHANDRMPPLAKSSLTAALHATKHSQCMTTNAWTLRRGLDRAYHLMTASVQP